MIEAKVIKVGFEKENPVLSIILLDLKTRGALNVQLGQVVKVTNIDDEEMLAVIMPQFKEFIGKGVAVNVVLGMALRLEPSDEVKLESFTPPEGTQTRFPASFLN